MFNPVNSAETSFSQVKAQIQNCFPRQEMNGDQSVGCLTVFFSLFKTSTSSLDPIPESIKKIKGVLNKAFAALSENEPKLLHKPQIVSLYTALKIACETDVADDENKTLTKIKGIIEGVNFNKAVVDEKAVNEYLDKFNEALGTSYQYQHSSEEPEPIAVEITASQNVYHGDVSFVASSYQGGTSYTG